MANTENYLDSLSDGDLEALENFDKEAISKKSNKIDRIIENAPKTDDLTVYKYYKRNDQLKDGGALIDPNYLIASTKKLETKDGAAIFEISIPANKLNAVKLVSDGNEGDIYLFNRELRVLFFPEQGGIVPATVEDAFLPQTVKASGALYRTKMIINSVPWDVVSGVELCIHGNPIEFANPCHAPDSGKFCPGSGGGRQTGTDKRQSQRISKLERTAKVARNITAILAIATIAITIIGFSQRQRDYKPDKPVREKRRLEAIDWLANNKKTTPKSSKPPGLPGGYHYDKDGKVVREKGQGLKLETSETEERRSVPQRPLTAKERASHEAYYDRF